VVELLGISDVQSSIKQLINAVSDLNKTVQRLVEGEVTVTLRSIEEVNSQLEKLNTSAIAAEKFTGKKTYLKLLAVENAPSEVSQYLTSKAKGQEIYLIIGREYEKS